MNEKDVLKQIKDYLKLQQYFLIRNQINAFGHKGLSDLTAIKRGKVYFIEVKAPKGKQRPDQIIFQKNLEKVGGTYILAGSVDDLIAKGL